MNSHSISIGAIEDYNLCSHFDKIFRFYASNSIRYKILRSP